MEGTKEERVYLAERNFVLFFIYYYLEYIKYPFAPFHFEAMAKMQQLIDDPINREFLFVGFRESAKSTIARAFDTWLTVFKKRKYILVASYDQGNAESVLFAVINALQTNARIKNDFGLLCPDMKNNEKGFNRIKKFLTAHGVLLEALTTQQSARGRLQTENRPDFVHLDDIETEKTVASDVYTEKTRMFLKELKTAMDAATGRVMYMANHISDLGVIQDIINRKEGILYMNVPILMGETLTWPSKYTLTDEMGKVTIESVKKLAEDSITFEKEYLNLPMTDSRRIFKRALFKYVDELPKNERLSCFVLIDPATVDEKELKENTDPDYTGVSIVWIDTKGHWYVKADRYRVGPKELIDLLFSVSDDYHPEKIGIEEFLYTKGIKPFLDDEMRRRQKHLPIVMLKHGGSAKGARIQGLLAYFEADTIFLLKGQAPILVEEALRFPNGKHDDVLDSLAYGPQIIYKPYDMQDLPDIIPEEAPLYPDIGI